MAPMQKYTCHKTVEALKIRAIEVHPDNDELEGAMLIPAHESYEPIHVDEDFLLKHEPEAGGYFVRYADGYESFSPEIAFEDGYTRS